MTDVHPDLAQELEQARAGQALAEQTMLAIEAQISRLSRELSRLEAANAYLGARLLEEQSAGDNLRAKVADLYRTFGAVEAIVRAV